MSRISGNTFHLRPTSPCEARPWAPQAPLFTRATEPNRTWHGAFKSIVARLPGFRYRLEKALAPMLAARTVGEMKAYFQTLPDVVGLASMRPSEAHGVLARMATASNALYVNLTAIACGDRAAMPRALAAIRDLAGNHALVLDCIRMTTRFRPDEAHVLLAALFENARVDTATRLGLFRELMMSGEFRKEALPTSFEVMMRGSTPEELNLFVYPSVLGLLKKWRPCSARLNLNREITKEMMRGWIASCEVITDHNHRRAQDVLMIPPSARG